MEHSIKVGDIVSIPWGLDMVPGKVEEIYSTGIGERVRVRLEPTEPGEGPTVVVPLSAVEKGAPQVPHGAWLTGIAYEKALISTLGTMIKDMGLEPSRVASRVYDGVYESAHQYLVIEVKIRIPDSRSLHHVLSRLAHFPRTQPNKALSILLVSPEPLPAKSSETAWKALPKDVAWKFALWKNTRDNRELSDALGELIGSLG